MKRGNTDVMPGNSFFREENLNAVILRVVFPVCLLAVYFLYLPVADHYFVSDDFKVLRRVCAEKQILIAGFFRPLSDLTIYGNFLLHGLDPVVFNAFNLMVHAATGALLFRFAFRLHHNGLSENKAAFRFATVTTLLFLSYPFHNEAVVWLLGRGASMAAFFCLAAMCYCQESRIRPAAKWICAGFYFLSLLAYESALVLPLILWLLLRKEERPVREQGRWLGVMGLAMALHLVLRVSLSGAVAGGYGGDFLPGNPLAVAGNIFRVLTRLFLPPMASTRLFLMAAVCLLVFVVLTVAILRRQKGDPVVSAISRRIGWISAMGLAAAVIAFLTGVSLHTSESDRMLYLPSIFVCLLAAAAIEIAKLKSNAGRLVLPVVIALQVFYLEKNNLRWREAGAITSDLVRKASGPQTGQRVFFLDVPGDISGAYVFRQGMADALFLNGKSLTDNNALSTSDSTHANRIYPPQTGDQVLVWNASAGHWTPAAPGRVP